MTIEATEICELIRIHLGTGEVGPGDRFQEDLDAESADLLNIVAAAEDRWGIVIAEEEMADLLAVVDLIELVRGRARV